MRQIIAHRSRRPARRAHAPAAAGARAPCSPTLAALAALLVLAAAGCAGPAEDDDSAGADASVSADSAGLDTSADAAGAGVEADAAGQPGIDAVEPAEGPTAGLTTVEIRGHGLATTTAIWFGESKALDLDIVDDTLLRCRTPPHPAGSVEVRLLRMDGDVVLPELALPLAYRYVPTITVLSVEPEHGPSAGGVLVTVRGTGFVKGTSFIFGDRLAIAAQIEDEFSATMFLPPGPVGAVAVTAANADGQARVRDGFTYEATAPGATVEGVTLSWFEPGRLDPKGGTAAKLRYTAPESLGALLGLEIGPLSGASIGPGPQGPQSLTFVAPAGSPGPADVTLIFADGKAVFHDAATFASELPRLVAVLPGRGSQSGGTLVDMVGDGLDRLKDVEFAGKSTYGLHTVHAGLARGRTPPAEGPGPVNLIGRFGSAGQNVVHHGYLYFDPAQETFGTWGEPIERAVNVTVMRADWPGGVVPDALVVVGDGSDPDLRDKTDARGQCVLTKVGLAGLLDVSASAVGFGAATVAGFDAENVTLLIRKYPEQGNGPPTQWPKKFFGTGTIAGRVLNHEKYNDMPRGRCGAGADAGAACAPCGAGAGCGAGLSCVAADPAVWPPVSATETATGLCLGLCVDNGDCAAGEQCRFVSLPGEATPTAACLPAVGTPQTRCATTIAGMYADNPDPGPLAIVAKDGSFKLNTRLGSLAVACRAGYVDAQTGAFVPRWLGVKRSVEVSDDSTVFKVDVTLDTRLDRVGVVRLEGLPIGPDTAGKRRYLDAWLDFGGEGALHMAKAESQARVDTLELEHLPTELDGPLAGLRYELFGGVETHFTENAAPHALGHVIGQQFESVSALVWWPKNEPAPTVVPSGAFAAVAGASGKAGVFAVGGSGRILAWSGSAWTPQQSPTDAHLGAIWMAPASDQGWAGGEGGVLLRRGGPTGAAGAGPKLGWQRVVSPTTARIVGLAGSAAADVWLLDAGGGLFHFDGASWTAANAGPVAGAAPTALRRLGDGALAVTTEAGGLYVGSVVDVGGGGAGSGAGSGAGGGGAGSGAGGGGAGSGAGGGGAGGGSAGGGSAGGGGGAGSLFWTTILKSSPAPLNDVDGAHAQAMWAVGARGRVVRVGKSGPVTLAKIKDVGLFGVRARAGGASVVGASGTWLEIDDSATPPVVTEVGPAGMAADLHDVVELGDSGGVVALSAPILALERWLEMPVITAPAADAAFNDQIVWSWPEGADAHLQFLQLTTFWEVPYWDIVTDGQRDSLKLPSFVNLLAWRPLPTGPLRLMVRRIWAPGLGVDHFSHDHLTWWSWTTWAHAQVPTFIVSKGIDPVP